MQVGLKLHGKRRSAAVLALLLGGSSTAAASEDDHYFASIHLDDDKIGQVHYTVQYDDQGEIEELKTRASVSVLGIEVFHFTQHLHEVWRDGELCAEAGQGRFLPCERPAAAQAPPPSRIPELIR